MRGTDHKPAPGQTPRVFRWARSRSSTSSVTWRRTSSSASPSVEPASFPLWAAWSLALTSPITVIAFPTHLHELLYLVIALWFVGSVPAALAVWRSRFEDAYCERSRSCLRYRRAKTSTQLELARRVSPLNRSARSSRLRRLVKDPKTRKPVRSRRNHLVAAIAATAMLIALTACGGGAAPNPVGGADLGSPRANWSQNAGVLRQAMSRGLPIRDASPGDTGGPFLNAERNLLRGRGWTFDPKTSYWFPPRR